MIKPIRHNLEIWKGADFIFNFRIKEDGAYVDVSEWDFTFTASDEPAGSAVFTLDTNESPGGIVVDSDDNYLVTITYSGDDTEVISNTGSLYYELDAVTTTGEAQRRLYGQIKLYEAAVSDD